MSRSSGAGPFETVRIDTRDLLAVVSPDRDPVDAIIAPAAHLIAVGVDSKQSQLAAIEAGVRVSIAPGKKTGAGANATQASQAMTAAATCVGTYPCIYAVPFAGFHQKTNYYCLVALVQSVAYQDLEYTYVYMGTGSVAGAQNKIYPLIGGSGTKGAIDSRALTWINQQFAAYSYGFHYLATLPANAAGFMNMVRWELNVPFEANHVRIDLTSYKYAWGQKANSDGTHPVHATAATGYNDSTGKVTSYDPFAYSAGEKGGPGSTCTSSSYSSTADWGCNWTILQGNYYLAMDKTGTSANYPMWY